MLASMLGRRLASLPGGLTPALASASPATSAAAVLSPLLASSSPPLTAQPRRHKMRDFLQDYFVYRAPPIGPHRKLAPGVKLNGRVGKTENYRRIVHYPEDGQYTIKKLPITKLGGRDPLTGRKIISGVGGGHKQKYRWIDWRRLPADWDPEGPDLVERVVNICYDPCRDAKIALTGYGDKLRWQIATENMQVGDLIRTTAKIPATPVKPVLGDSYPLGALPVGTEVCLVQQMPNTDKVEDFHGGDSATILRKVKDRVHIKSGNQLDYSLDERCQCVVGKVSIHHLKAISYGSPNRKRWLGITPQSGLWHRKTGRFGRKIKKPPPIEEVREKPEPKKYLVTMHIESEGTRGKARGSKRPPPVYY